MRFDYDAIMAKLDDTASFRLDLPGDDPVTVESVLLWDADKITKVEELLRGMRRSDPESAETLVRAVLGDEQTDRALAAPRMQMVLLSRMVTEWITDGEVPSLGEGSASLSE